MDQEREQLIRAKKLTEEERRLRKRARGWMYAHKKRMERAAKDPNYRQYLERRKETGKERLPHGYWSSNLTPEEWRIRKKVKIQVDTQNHCGYKSEYFNYLRRQQRAAKVAAEKQKVAAVNEDATSQAQPPQEIPAIKKRRRLVRPNYHAPPPDESDQNDDCDEPPAPPSPVLRPGEDVPAAGSSAGASSSETRISRALMNLGFDFDEDE